MEHESPKLMTPFDCQTIPQWIYILKILLPYTPLSLQHSLAVFIRIQEMQFTMKHFHNFSPKIPSHNIINDVKPFMDSETQEMLEQMESIISMMDMMQMMQNFQENTSPDFNPMDILSGFMDHDFIDIFNMKGDSEHE